MARAALGTERAAFMVLDSDGRFVMQHAKVTGAPLENFVVPKTVLAEVRSTKAAVLSPDALFDRRLERAHSVIIQGIRMTVTLPLLAGDDLLGVLHFHSHTSRRAVSPGELEILTAIAALAAAVVRNASEQHQAATRA